MIPPLPSDIFHQGQVLNNTYEIEGVLGRGGTGEVYRARNLVSGRIVAVKALARQFSGNEDYVELMRREEQMRDVSHDAVVRYTECSRSDDGHVFLVMDYIEGPSLQDEMRVRRFEPRELLIVGHRMSEGLEAAHRRGMVHRDLSPDNVVLRDGAPERATLIDFGIAKDTAVGARTIVGNDFAGKYEYAAPEQLEGKADVRSDLYALGASLLAAWRGEVPFAGATPGEMVRRKREPLDLDGVPEPLKGLVARLAEPEAAKRPASAAEARELFEEALRIGGKGKAAAAAPPADRSLDLVAAVAALVLVAGAGGLWWTGRLDPLVAAVRPGAETPPGPEAEPTPGPEPSPGPMPEPGPAPSPQPGSEVQAGPGPAPEPEPPPASAPDPVPQPAPAPTPQPAPAPKPSSETPPIELPPAGPPAAEPVSPAPTLPAEPEAPAAPEVEAAPSSPAPQDLASAGERAAPPTPPSPGGEAPPEVAPASSPAPAPAPEPIPEPALPVADPYRLSVAVGTGGAVVAGEVPDDRAAAELRAALTALTGAAPDESALRRAAGVPSDLWLRGIVDLVVASLGLEGLRIEAEGTRARVEGVAADAATRDQIAARLASAGAAAGLTLDLRLSVAPAPPLEPAALLGLAAAAGGCGPFAAVNPPAGGWPEGATVALRGAVADPAAEAAVRGALAPALAGRALELQLETLNAPVCAVRAALPDVGTGGMAIRLLDGDSGASNDSGVFGLDANPVVEVEIPAEVARGSLWVALVLNTGEVYNLLPNINDPEHRVAALGEVEGGVRRLRVLHSVAEFQADRTRIAFRVGADDAGKSEVVAILSREPLFEIRRPRDESVESFVQGLREALAADPTNVLALASAIIDSQP